VHHEKEKKRARKREGRVSAPDPAAVGSVVENSSGARLPEWNRATRWCVCLDWTYSGSFLFSSIEMHDPFQKKIHHGVLYMYIHIYINLKMNIPAPEHFKGTETLL